MIFVLKSCVYCGRIHDSKYDCGKRPQRKRDSKASFRSTAEWQSKRTEINERDLYLCRVCLDNGRLTYNGISVHHIEPLEENYEKRLDNDNLITLCAGHHEQAERGDIPRAQLHELANSPPTPKG
ncbi:MAG: HNH endonuclease [Oscillospiraceae bacterium]